MSTHSPCLILFFVHYFFHLENSLAAAFRQFPMDADPDRTTQDQTKTEMDEEPRTEFDLEDDFSDDDETSDDEEDFVVSDSKCSSAEEDIVLDDYPEEDDNNRRATNNQVQEDPSLRNEILHLGESDYDTPGTVELVLNRKCYRVGQSFYSAPDKKIIYTITMIHPQLRKAKCQTYMRMEDTFVCPKGSEGEYAQLGGKEEAIIDLASLKFPCREIVKKFSMKYEQDERQRSFSYYNEKGEIKHHPLSKPNVCKSYNH